MYHGEDSGHLMVHCNNKVMLIDFGVTDTKNYSFFLDQELFELQLTRENGNFSYNLKHNEEIDSPHNRRREQEKKTGRWRIIATAVVFVFFGLILLAAWSKNPADDLALMEELAAGSGIATEASLYLQAGKWQATYRADDMVKEITLQSIHPVEVKGLNLQNGDRFAARYSTENSSVLLIDWNRPSPATLAHFQQQTMQKHARLHPELSPQQIGCQVRLAYELKGLDGLGILMGQQRKDAPKYNNQAYLRLTRSTEFRAGNRECL